MYSKTLGLSLEALTGGVCVSGGSSAHARKEEKVFTPHEKWVTLKSTGGFLLPSRM